MKEYVFNNTVVSLIILILHLFAVVVVSELLLLFFSSYFCNLTRSLLPTRSSQTSFENVEGTTARVRTSLCLSKQEAAHLALFEEKSNSHASLPKMYSWPMLSAERKKPNTS